MRVVAAVAALICIIEVAELRIDHSGGGFRWISSGPNYSAHSQVSCNARVINIFVPNPKANDVYPLSSKLPEQVWRWNDDISQTVVGARAERCACDKKKRSWTIWYPRASLSGGNSKTPAVRLPLKLASIVLNADLNIPANNCIFVWPVTYRDAGIVPSKPATKHGLGLFDVSLPPGFEVTTGGENRRRSSKYSYENIEGIALTPVELLGCAMLFVGGMVVMAIFMSGGHRFGWIWALAGWIGAVIAGFTMLPH